MTKKKSSKWALITHDDNKDKANESQSTENDHREMQSNHTTLSVGVLFFLTLKKNVAFKFSNHWQFLEAQWINVALMLPGFGVWFPFWLLILERIHDIIRYFNEAMFHRLVPHFHTVTHHPFHHLNWWQHSALSLLHLTAQRKSLLHIASPCLNHHAPGGCLLHAATASLTDKRHFHLPSSQIKTQHHYLLHPFLISHESVPAPWWLFRGQVLIQGSGWVWVCEGLRVGVSRLLI